MKDISKIERYLNHLIANSTPPKPAWNKEALLEDHAPKWNYIDGCMIKAVVDMYHATKEEKYITFAESFVDYYVREDGSILGYSVEELNCDNINPGKVLFPLYDYSQKEKYKKALDLLYSQIQVQPRTKGGNFWHKKIYPNQIWLDGLYMVQPFYLEYEKRFNKYRNYLDVFNQFEKVYQLMRDQTTGLFYHGYDENKEMFWANPATGLSQNFWTRSLGWYAMALSDTLAVMDEQFFLEYRTLQIHLKELLDSLLAFQDQETKLFYQVTDQGDTPGNYLETSGSAAIAYALIKGANENHLPVEYFAYGAEILDSLANNKLIERNGILVLQDICLVAGLGGMPGKGDYKLRDGSFAYYVSEPIVADDAKGVAPFLFGTAAYLSM